ncbi:hypothetical protein KSP39_PZI000026 [Platanthera zijinensis]|uniref:Uncharacterized protein n=1 Tax=Platanthera zijinensis TaxID=2320716 RepID=A0AAP0GFB2_9ASPA
MQGNEHFTRSMNLNLRYMVVGGVEVGEHAWERLNLSHAELAAIFVAKAVVLKASGLHGDHSDDPIPKTSPMEDKIAEKKTTQNVKFVATRNQGNDRPDIKIGESFAVDMQNEWHIGGMVVNACLAAYEWHTKVRWTQASPTLRRSRQTMVVTTMRFFCTCDPDKSESYIYE